MSEVGEKLCIMELQEEENDDVDYQTFAKDFEKSTSTSPSIPKKAVSSERSSFEQGSPGDLDSGCPGSERSASTQFQHLSKIRNLSHVEEVLTPTSEEEIDLSPNLPKPKSAESTPRGTHTILAQQIDQEILALRNFFEDHREEMLSMINNEKNDKKVSMTSAGCSPIVFEQKSPKRSAKRKTKRQQIISDTSEETCPDVQEERRQEFEKRRLLKKKPQFAIGQPMTSEISSLFPRLNENEQGRHVTTIDGDQVFIPKLSLEDQWSMEDPSKSIEVKVEDKSCQVDRPKRAKKKKVNSHFSILMFLNFFSQFFRISRPFWKLWHWQIKWQPN